MRAACKSKQILERWKEKIFLRIPLEVIVLVMLEVSPSSGILVNRWLILFICFLIDINQFELDII